MAVQSGISCSEELKKAFADAQDGGGFLKLEIVSDTFKATSQGPTAGDLAGNLAAAQKTLEDRKPCYIVARADADKWLFTFFMPDNCTVRDRMLYASSSNSCKLGLGASKFLSPDLTIREKAECSAAHYDQNRAKVSQESVMTWEERVAAEAAKDSIMTMSISTSAGTSKLSGMSDLPVKSTEDANKAIEAVQSGEHRAALLFLDGSSEQLGKDAAGDLNLDAIRARLPEKEPRYAVFNFPHNHPETKEAASAIIFLYYCPNAAPPRQKMFYSSSKSNILKLCDAAGLAVTKNIEVSEGKEVTEALLLEELYPKKVETPKFAKPKAAGRPAAAKFTGARFNAASPTNAASP